MNPSRSVEESQNAQPPQLIGSKFHRVPLLIRREDRSGGSYGPKVVSFGPYHHGKPELLACEVVKFLALQIFVEGSNHELEFFRAKVLEVISEARNCYIDGSTDQYTDEQFAEMMLLDSCFLISLMYTNTMNPQALQSQSYFDYIPVFILLGNLAHSSATTRAVFLMENQIPFKILMLLITLRYDNGKDSVNRFLQMAAWNKFGEQLLEDIQQRPAESSPLHLLEALRTVLVWD